MLAKGIVRLSPILATIARTLYLKQLTARACASSHCWGREIIKLGHDVRLILPIYVKPFVKRQKNGANDAEAIAEAAVRPTMRFVPVKSAEQQSRSMVFKTRDLFVRQRNAIINALRGHLMG